MNQRHFERRKEIEAVFERSPKVEDSDEEFVSPSGLYKLHVASYHVGENCWEYSRGIVTRLSDGEIITDVKRNFGLFWHAWVEHPNGNEYLLCGEDYQGYSVVNLTEVSYQTYFPDEAYEGAGFCWTAVYPSPDKLVLAVEGCFWACPYELVFYDLRTPDEVPFREIGRVSDTMRCDGWIDNENFVLSVQGVYRKSDGIAYNQLSEDKQQLLDSDLSLLDYRTEKLQAKRPDFDSTTQDSPYLSFVYGEPRS